VRRIYLPVGDPQITSYRYGIIKKGGRLSIEFDPLLLDKADVYVTYCNRWGFPAFWDEVRESKFLSRAADQDVVYLMRVVNFQNEEVLRLEDYHFSCKALEKRAAYQASVAADQGSVKIAG
jgi:hypothetical protein